jgi:hypothetical protein
MTLKQQKRFALKLLDWHGGMHSGIYAVASCMLSDAEQGRKYETKNHRGHAEAYVRALRELLFLKEKANFPESVTAKDSAECKELARKLASDFI